MEAGARFRVVGCGVATLLVLVFFIALLNMANRAAEKIAAKKNAPPPASLGTYVATKEGPGDDATFDFVLLNDAIARYASDHKGAFPPMNSPAAFKNALYPKYVPAEDTLRNNRDNQGYLPNAGWSGKMRKYIASPSETPLLYESTNLPGKKTRLALMADGKVLEIAAP